MAMVILAGAAALCLVGLLDDRFGLGPWLKLIVQAGVTGAVVEVADVRILTMLGGPASTALSVLWMLIIINAMNFMDNMDGLTGGVDAKDGDVVPREVTEQTAVVAGYLQHEGSGVQATPRDQFVRAEGGQAVRAGQVHDLDAPAVAVERAALLLDRHSGVVADMLAGAGEGVEDRRLAAVGIPGQCDRESPRADRVARSRLIR